MLRFHATNKSPFRERENAQSGSVSARFEKIKASVGEIFHKQKKIPREDNTPTSVPAGVAEPPSHVREIGIEDAEVLPPSTSVDVATLPLLPVDGLLVLHFDVLEVALARLDIKVPLNDIIAVAREEEAKSRKAQADVTKRRAALSMLALHPSAQPSGLNFTTTSESIRDPPPRTYVDPLAKQRRRRLIELTEEAFPNGKVPVPFTLAWLGLSEDESANKLAFIQARRIVVTSQTAQGPDPPKEIFKDVWCLWDTGAQSSFVITSRLNPAVRDNQDEGYAVMEITFAGTSLIVDSVIRFCPTLPNGTTFIILGQHGLINRIHYQIEPASLNPRISLIKPLAYGRIQLISWCDPVTEEAVYF